MSNFKSFLVWLVVVTVCAAVTIVAVQALEQPMSLRQKVATFGK